MRTYYYGHELLKYGLGGMIWLIRTNKKAGRFGSCLFVYLQITFCPPHLL
jgi:hypothetical protein